MSLVAVTTLIDIHGGRCLEIVAAREILVTCVSCFSSFFSSLFHVVCVCVCVCVCCW